MPHNSGRQSQRSKRRSGTDGLFAISQAVESVAGMVALDTSSAGSTSPDHMTCAIHAVKTEGDLDDDGVLDAISLFQNDPKASIAYLAIGRQGLRKKWLQCQLLLTGAATLDFCMFPDA